MASCIVEIYCVGCKILKGCEMEDRMLKWYDHEGYVRTVHISKGIATVFILTFWRRNYFF